MNKPIQEQIDELLRQAQQSPMPLVLPRVDLLTAGQFKWLLKYIEDAKQVFNEAITGCEQP